MGTKTAIHITYIYPGDRQITLTYKEKIAPEDLRPRQIARVLFKTRAPWDHFYCVKIKVGDLPAVSFVIADF